MEAERIDAATITPPSICPRFGKKDMLTSVRIFGFLVSTAAAACLIAIGGASAQTREVSVGLVNAITDVPLLLAEKKKYLEAEGLRARFINFDGGAKMIAPLGMGELDVGAGAMSAGFYNAMARNVPIRIVADKSSNTADYNFKSVMVRKTLVDSGKVKSLKDLKGLKIGIGGGAGGMDTSIVNDMLKAGGLTYRDVETSWVNFPQLPMALQNGSIDVAIVPEPYVALGKSIGGVVELTPISSFLPTQQTGVLIYGRRMLDNRDVGVRFMKAYIRAIRDWDDALLNRRLAGPGAAEIIDVIMENKMVQKREIFTEMVPNWVDPDGKLALATLEKDLAFWRQEKLVSSDIQVRDVVDPTFAETAARELGPYKRKQ
jgi:NitT/TauT family transport system substrate-binding protein